MAGYAEDYSKSNNALAAEDQGLYPASVVAKMLRVPVSAVRAAGRDEWHHTSGWYNRTEYYSAERIAEWLQTEDGMEAMAKARADKNNAPRVVESADVHWIEWGGTRRRPTATEHKAKGCRVEIKGQTATITLPSGKQFRKRMGANGFQFFAET